MIRKQTLVGLILCAAPLVVVAQNSNTPGGQASTGTPLEQTKTSSQKPAFHKKPKMNATDTPGDSSEGMSKPKRRAKAANPTPSGDVPTYPAPAPDGTPTN